MFDLGYHPYYRDRYDPPNRIGRPVDCPIAGLEALCWQHVDSITVGVDDTGLGVAVVDAAESMDSRRIDELMDDLEVRTMRIPSKTSRRLLRSTMAMPDARMTYASIRRAVIRLIENECEKVKRTVLRGRAGFRFHRTIELQYRRIMWFDSVSILVRGSIDRSNIPNLLDSASETLDRQFAESDRMSELASRLTMSIVALATVTAALEGDWRGLTHIDLGVLFLIVVFLATLTVLSWPRKP